MPEHHKNINLSDSGCGGDAGAFRAEEGLDPVSGFHYTSYIHGSGLRILYLPKPGFRRRFAAFGVPFGSAVTAFHDKDGKRQSIIPGSAHYLEHCVFSRGEDGGLTGRLAEWGCQANAYTSYHQTVYFFSGVEHFSEAFCLFYDTLTAPYLEEDRIEAERGIIAAELDMYMDDPTAFAYRALMSNLYLEHGAKEDIGGTPESIQKITADMLKDCWRNFYTPRTMSIILCGDFKPDELAQLLRRINERLMSNPPTAPGEALRVDEPCRVARAEQILHRDIENPAFLIGIKDPLDFRAAGFTPRKIAERNLCATLFLDSVLGDSSEPYHRLYANGLINDSFSIQYVCEEDFAFILASGDTARPERAVREILNTLRAALDPDKWSSAGIGPEIFDILKKTATGHYLRSLDGVDSAGITGVQARLAGLDLPDYAGSIVSADLEQACDILSFAKDERLTAAVYLKKEARGDLRADAEENL